MKKDDILDSIGYVDPVLISRAESYTTAKKNKAPLRWGAPAACLCLVLFASAIIPRLTGTAPTPDGDSDTDNGETCAYAVYTDDITLPESSNGIKADMIGCLVYKGSVYTQGASYYGDLSGVEHLVGDYLGEAVGTLDEWSAQDEWSTDFASTYSGPVYSVKGYNEAFRLCIYVQNGSEKWLQFLDNFDGIGLSTGKDLFDDRLRIKGNVSEVTYVTHREWSSGDPTERSFLKPDLTDDQLEWFIEVLCSSPFERIDYFEAPDLYDTGMQGHLYLKMNDGTSVELTLIDGGYVGCAGLRWFFVRMPGDIFDAVLSACQ